MAMSNEQKEAARQRMKAMHAAKKAAKENVSNEGVDTVPEGLAVETIQVETPRDDLERRVEELSALVRQLTQNQPVVAPQQVQVGQMGRLLGVEEKFIIDPAHYPNPCARLAKEPRLQRFAFEINYDLSFDMSVTSYENKYGVNVSEPKFTVQLNRVVMNDDGEPTNGRYKVCSMVFFEDPQAALVIAREQGLDIDQSNKKFFLDEMRYLRVRDWLLEAFYPKAAQPMNDKKTVVIDGKAVEFFTVNSEDAQSPFKNMDSTTKRF